MTRSTRVRRGAALLTMALGAALLALTSASPASAAIATTGELTAGDPAGPLVQGSGTCGDATAEFGGPRNYDVYPFYVTAPESVTIDLRGAATGGGTVNDPWLQVYCNVFDPATPSANVIASDDDAGTGLDSRLVLALEPGVQYYAVATTCCGGLFGTYSLEMSGTATAGFIAVQAVPSITVSASTATAAEGGAPGAFTFTRTGDRFSTLTVTYSVTGTATSGDDYEALAGTVNFPYGETTVTVPVTALGDSAADAGETVIVNVEFGPYDRPEPRSATVTINEAAAAPVDVCAGVPDAGYPDVPETYTHDDAIDCITAYGLAEGYPDGTYRFRPAVTRAQMASFVARLLDRTGVALPASPSDAFTADDGGVHELAIDQLAALGIFDGTTGEQGETYGQNEPMRRDDMAQILVNAYTVITGEDLPAGADAFTDDEASDNEDAINALAAAGVVEGTGGALYDPDGSVSRGQYASFFARYLQVLVDAGETIQPA